MFDNLVESSSHKKDIERKGSFIVGTAVIYGAVVIEGEGTLNGGLKIISSPETLAAILKDPNNIRFARVPGTWNDSLSY